jgi:hypothetical protein
MGCLTTNLTRRKSSLQRLNKKIGVVIPNKEKAIWRSSAKRAKAVSGIGRPLAKKNTTG